MDVQTSDTPIAHGDAAARTAPKLDPEHGRDHAQYLTFKLGRETFAIGILSIREIIEYGGLTEVPLMPACIRGVINLRGAVVPVMDLSARFGRPPEPVTKYTCIVIVEIESEHEQQVIGVVVDAVNAVVEIAPGEIEPPPKFGTDLRTDFISGMGKVDGKFVILLQVESVLSIEEVSALVALRESAPALEGAASATA